MSVSRIILSAVTAVLNDGAYANLAIKDALCGSDGDAKSRVTATVYSVIEHIFYIDYILDRYINGKVNRHIRNILRIVVARVVFMHNPCHSVCDDAVKLTREIGKQMLSGYVNAVARSICRDTEAGSLPPLPSNVREAMGIELNCPRWLVDEYCSRFGENTTRSMLSCGDSGVTIRAQYPFTTAELEKYLGEHGIEFSRGKYLNEIFKIKSGASIINGQLFRDGKITIQSESSALVCVVSDAKKGMRILDACAAPGGKSSLFANNMENTGSIVAWDIHKHRVELIKKTFERLNVSNATTTLHDASIPIPELYGQFDVVLVDAPCSGLGVRGKPDIRCKATVESVNELADIQLKLLNTCAKYVKDGGILTYSTCTISYKENEQVTKSFLNGNSGFCADENILLPHSLKERFSNGCLTLFPHLDDTDGFFIARMKKVT